MRKLALFPIAVVLASCNAEQAADNMMDVGVTASANESRPKFPCEAIENMLATAEDCADLTALQKDVRPGPAALDAPDKMVRGKTYEVTLVIDRPKPAPPPPAPPLPPQTDPGENAMDSVENVMDSVSNVAETDTNMSDAIEPAAGSRDDETDAPTANEVVAQLPGQDTTFDPQVGRNMTAELTGSGFDIKLISPSKPTQVIPQGGQGRWQWEVKPTMGGQRWLTVKTHAVGIVDGKEVPLGNGGSEHQVAVKVSWPDRIWDALTAAPAWIKAVTAVLVALAALGAAWVPIRKWFRKSPRK